MAKDKTLQQAVDQNYEAFKKLLPDLMRTESGRYALMRNGETIEFFDSPRDAMIYAQKSYPDGLFSIQQVSDKVVDLGYFSHAMPHTAI